MHDSAVQPHIVEAVVNHVTGHEKGLAGAYNPATYAGEQRAALETLAAYVRTAVAKPSGANVTRLPQRG